MTKRAVVAGAGGFLGHHLVRRLKAVGYWVRGVDVKPPQYVESAADEFNTLDLREFASCVEATSDVDEVYQLAADMGGIGYISEIRSDVARNNVLIDTHMLEASHHNRVARYLFTSSACVYPIRRQNAPDVAPLREEDAHPADPEEGYGWEKLYAEKLCQYYTEEGKLDTRVVRLHNAYGPLGTFDGGREKAPAAICRKVALAEDGGEIEVWGDGEQTRSFMYADDCVEGLVRIMGADHRDPLNLGTEELVTVNELVDLVADVAGKEIRKRYLLEKPQGVRGRNSDNARLREVLGWEPQTSLAEGLRGTYAWIEAQLRAREETSSAAR
ncbi:MAG: NAD-dependent epimerase/dehydratase family protein [Actinomycetota bacterium]